jgi:hypothetical protein
MSHAASRQGAEALAAWAEALPAHEGRGVPRTYRALWQEIAAVALARPDIVRVGAHGESVRGEPIWHVVVERDARAPAVLVLAGLHSMEHVGPITALALLRRAAGDDPGPWAQRRLVLAPIANPDGFLEVERARADGSRGFRRKNAHGVDLNRNFAEGWHGAHWLNRALPKYFAAGDGPLSEPETAALDALAGRERPAAAVSLHAFGEWIYLPWAGRREAPPDLDGMMAVARAMAAAQPRPYRVVQLARRSRFFVARGAEIDHLYGKHGAWSFLIEIGAGPRLGDPSGWLDAYRWFTPRDDLLAADVANVLPALDAVAQAELPPGR